MSKQASNNATTVSAVWTAAVETARGSRKLARVARDLIAQLGFVEAQESCYTHAREQIEKAGSNAAHVEARTAAYAALRKAFSRARKAARDEALRAAIEGIKAGDDLAAVCKAARRAADEVARGAFDADAVAEIVKSVAAEMAEAAAETETGNEDKSDRGAAHHVPDTSRSNIQAAFDTLAAAVVASDGAGKDDAWAGLEHVAAFLRLDAGE